jgi:hypothetical protein
MYQVNIKVQLELLDEENFSADWIRGAIQDSLMEADGEKITKFLVVSFPILENIYTREKPPPKVPELSNNTTTITSQGPESPQYSFFADANWDGRNNT